MSGNVPVYTASEKCRSFREKAGGSKGHQIYMQLMNGVSHMLPFVVGGGILIALAFLIDGLCVDMTSLTAEARQSFGSITPVAATLKSIGDLAFGFMLPVLAGFIAMSIADRPGLAVGFVGGAIAANGKSGFLGALVAGFLAGYLILLLKNCSKTSGSTGKNCPSPSLSGIRHSDRGTCYDVCRRASNRSIEHGTEHSSYKHEWFQ